jgi:hypothetical protein
MREAHVTGEAVAADPAKLARALTTIASDEDRRAASSPAPMPSPPPNIKSPTLVRAQIEANRDLSTSLAFD